MSTPSTRLWLAAAAGAGLLLLGGMVMVVDPAEVAVVYRFGKVTRTAQAGLALRLPWPIETDERVSVTEIRRIQLPGRRMLSGDSNLIQLALSVHFTVSDPIGFATAATEPQAHVSSTVMAAATHTIASMDIDTLLTTARSSLEQEVQGRAQADLDELGVGVQLEAVEARELGPPEAVVDAFNDVSSARGDKDTVILAAESYASRVLPDMRGEASKRVEEAGSHAATLRARAEADVDRFEVLRKAYRNAPAATRQQLVLEMWERAGDRVDVIVAEPGTRVVLPDGVKPRSR